MSDATTTDANVCVATDERKPSHINSDVMDIYKSMKATSITELNGVEEGVIKENDVSYSLQVSTDNKVNESEYYKELNADNLGCLLCRKKSDNPESGGFYLYVFDTYYSKDSTADNPIVAVAIQSAFHPDEDAELKDVHNYYREIEVNKINPRNATLLEMHIILSHKEYQASILIFIIGIITPISIVVCTMITLVLSSLGVFAIKRDGKAKEDTI